MASLLFRRSVEGHGPWLRLPLPRHIAFLEEGDAPRLTEVQGPEAVAAIVPYQQHSPGPVRHLIISTRPRAALYRNGQLMRAGMARLVDHDYIAVAHSRFFVDLFSAAVPSLYDGDEEMLCVLCRGELAGQVVVCPGCSLNYCECCWLASQNCECGQPTALDQQPTWLPAGFPGSR